MRNTWRTYHQQEELNFKSFTPFELKDTYTTIQIKSDVANQSSKLDTNNQVDGVLFLAQTLKGEVLQGTQKQQKKNLRQLKKLFVQFTSIATMAGAGMTYGIITAAPLTASANIFMTTPANTLPTTKITPESIMDWALELALLIRSIGIGLAISMFSIVGIYIILNRTKTKEGIEWNTNIIKGAIQVIVSIPLIWSLYQLSQIVFRSLPFLDMFSSR